MSAGLEEKARDHTYLVRLLLGVVAAPLAVLGLLFPLGALSLVAVFGLGLLLSLASAAARPFGVGLVFGIFAAPALLGVVLS